MQSSLPGVDAPAIGEEDFHPTPERVVHALLEHAPPPAGPILEPAAGAGAILQVLREAGWAKDDLIAVELRAEEEPALRQLAGTVWMGDWMQVRHEMAGVGPGLERRQPCPECIDHFHQVEPCSCCGRLDAEHVPAVDPDGAWVDARAPSCWRGWPASTVITNPPFKMLPEFMAACLNGKGHLRYLALLMPISELAGKQSTAKVLRRFPPTQLMPISWRPWHGVRGIGWFIWRRDDPPLNINYV